MQTKQPAEHQADDAKRVRKQLRSIIGEQVIHVLGQPSGLQRVQVRKLWDDRYRVNIYIGPDPTSAIVAHSFFLVTDAEGNIIAATPRITKQY
jgi:hypothetical protein